MYPDGDPPVAPDLGQERHASKGGGAYSGNILEPLPQPFMQRNELRWGISCRARIDTKQHQPARVEPWIDILQIAQRLNEEAGDDEEDERKRDLEDHQTLAES